MRVLVFLQGTVLVARASASLSREERVEASRSSPRTDTGDDVPIGYAAAKVRAWRDRGAEIAYLSAARTPGVVAANERVLRRFGFPPGPVFWRRATEDYAATAARAAPDVIVEDDCESIGGEPEMTYPHIAPELQRRIRSVVVPEFGGIDHLTDDPAALGE